MSPRRINNLLALAVLSYLTMRPMHPYELGRTLRDHRDDRSIKFNHGSLYMVVKKLADVGLIEAGESSRDGQRPERTVYSITDAGREELHSWLSELLEQPQHEYPKFVAALSIIAALPPDEVVGLLTRRIEHLTAELNRLRREIDEVIDQGVHPLFQIEEEYRISMLDAEITFVRDFIARITDASTGIRAMWQSYHSHQSPEDTP